MGKTNYSKMSTQKFKNQEAPVLKSPIDVEPEVDETCGACAINLDELETPKEIVGSVTGCAKLNVRAKPNTGADILEVIEAGEYVAIDEKSLGKTWYKVTTVKGTEGYCMKEYITIV